MGRQLWFIVRLSSMLLLGLCGLAGSYQISGISAGTNSATGERPIRQEINKFAGSGAAFDLFILALQQLQITDQIELLSYFQLSGIHGFPHIPWDGVNGTYGSPGYCPHNSPLFAPWHRPYVVLYEQILWDAAQTIARSYPLSQRDQYTAAAITFRMPYWDSTAYPFLPQVATTPTIGVNTPNGYTQIANPLYTYNFLQNATENGFPLNMPFANFPYTVRHWDVVTFQSNQSQANANLLGQAPTILSETYQMFTTVTDFGTFATTNQKITGNNLENIHNSIHNSVGGKGHMLIIEIAAFDPIFWLHHTNVDRLFAMWQALNPDSYIQPTFDTSSTYVQAPNSTDSGSTSLYPFHSDNGTTIYTVDDVRGTRRFGYTYPELIDWNVSITELQSNVRSVVNMLYNPGTSTTPKPSQVKLAVRTADIRSAFSHITFDMVKSLGVNNLPMQWCVQIDIEQFAYDGSFMVDFFMGTPPADPSLWATAPNLIGSHAQLMATNTSSVRPNSSPQGLIRGEVSMTHTLAAGVARGVIDDMSPESVLQLLHDNLQWRARSADSREIDVAEIAGLSISVASRSLTPTTELCEFPVYGDFEHHPNVTRHKRGGSQQWR